LDESAFEESTPGLAPVKQVVAIPHFTQLDTSLRRSNTPREDTTRYILRPITDNEQILIVLHVSLHIPLVDIYDHRKVLY
jgi:hypothetical protein